MICFFLFIEEFASYDLSVKRHVAEFSEQEHYVSSRSTNFKSCRINSVDRLEKSVDRPNPRLQSSK
ncbi:hypothetical protein KSS87_021549 [Heliosperma pusillum]|nr:hypothetical protein KSS87_021549 [Heliosperma pusillum]